METKMISYAPLILLSSVVVRILVKGASIGDSIAVLALTLLYGYFLYQESQKAKPLNKEFIDRLSEVEKVGQDLKTKLASLMLGGGFNVKR